MTVSEVDSFHPAKTYKMLSKERPRLYIDIPLHKIKEIILDHFGFRLWLADSGQVYSFLHLEIDKKAQLVNVIKENASRYMKTTIPITVTESSASNIAGKISDKSRNSVFIIFDAFKINPFGDVIDIKVGMNASNIFEIIDGKVQNKLVLGGITEVVRDSDHVCKIRLEYTRHDRITYIFRPEEYDSFIANLYHLLEDAVANRPEKYHGMSIMEERVSVYSLFSVKNIEDQVPMIGLTSSAKIDEVLLASIHTNTDLPKLTAQLSEVIANSLMKNEINFSTLLNVLISNVTEIAVFFEHVQFQQILEIGREHRDESTRSMFKNVHEKNLIVVDESKPVPTPDYLLELIVELDNRKKEMEKRIGYVAGRAQKFETFLAKSEVTNNVEFCSKALEFLTVCTNNPYFFKEFAIHINIPKPNTTEAYKLFLRAVQKLALQKFNRVLSHNAMNFLHKFIKSVQPNFDQNAEKMNKNLLLSEKCGLTFARDALTFIGELCLITPKEKLERSINQNALVIYDILKIFEAVVYDRRDTTVPDDLVIVLKWLSNHLAFCVFKILMRSSSQCVVFKTSVLMNCIFQGMGSTQNIGDYQKLILNHSTLMLRNIELLLMPVSKRQKQISVVLLYNCLNNNASAAALMTRMIPKSLFRKVDSTSNDISKWTLIQWEELFDRVNSNYSTAVEQWNDDCRLELLQKLRQSQNEFEDHWNVLEISRFSDMIEATQKSRDGQLDSNKSNALVQLRWNYEEYEVKYSVLELQLPVWKYYLEQLYLETEDATLQVEITNPRKFWEELSIQLISREDYYIRKKILQTMILVYKGYSEKIKELSLLPYLVKVLSTGGDDDGGSFQYLVLQLVFTSLNIDDQLISSQNIRKFNEKGGLQIIRTHIAKKYFFDNLDELNYQDIKKNAVDKSITRKKTMTANAFIYSKAALKDSITYNFSSANLQREAYSPQYKKSNEILLCLNIIKVCIAKTKSQSEDLMLFPRPFARQMVSEKESVNLFNQLLLIRDSNIVVITQEIIALSYFNRFSFKHITTGTNYTERSLYGMFERTTGEAVAKNLRQLFFLVQQDAPEEIKKVLDRFKTYGYLDSDTASDETDNEKERAVKEKIFEMYPLFKSLPTTMIYILIHNGWDDFCKVFYSNSFQMPNLYWNADMRKQLLAEMKEKFRGEFDRLRINHEKFILNKLSVGIFEPLYQPSRLIEFKAVHKELVCDGIFLKFWVMPEYEDFEIQETQIPRMVSRLHRMLEKKVDSVLTDTNPDLAVYQQDRIKDIYIILKAELKILEKYSVSNDHCYASLEKIFEIWNGISFSDLTSKGSVAANMWELVIGNVLKIITCSLSPNVKENLDDFKKNIDLKGGLLKAVSRLINRLLTDKFCSLNSLRIMHQFIKAMKQIQQNMVSTADIFKDVDTTVHDCYNIFEILTFMLHPYQLYFSYLLSNNFSTIYDSNRAVGQERVRRSIYVVFSQKDIADLGMGNRLSMVSPRSEQDTPQMDPSMSNIIDLLRVNEFTTGFSFVVEDKVVRLTQDTLEVIDELCDLPSCATSLVSSHMLYRLFQIGTYHIPKEVRNTNEYTLDSNYHLTESFKRISDKAFDCLKQLMIMLLEGSLNAGNTHLEELLKDMDTASFNRIRENADTIRFEDNRMLEAALEEARTFFGDAIIRGVVKVYFEPDRVDMLRDDIVSSSTDLQALNSSRILDGNDTISKEFMGWGGTSSLVLSKSSVDKIKVNIAEIRQRLDNQVILNRREEVRGVMNLMKKALGKGSSSEMIVEGVFVESFVQSPYRLDKPGEFVKTCSELITGTERKNHSHLVILLNAMKIVFRDEPTLDPGEEVVQKIVKLYEEVESEWNDIKQLIVELFVCLSSSLSSLDRPDPWANCLQLYRLLLQIWHDFNGNQSEESYQLVLKWVLVLSQLLFTEIGMRAVVKNHVLLGICKIVFEQSFNHFIRVKMGDCLIRIHQDNMLPAELSQLIDLLSEVCDLKGSLTGENLAKEIEREQVNPSFVFTRISSYKNRERYNKEMRQVIKEMDKVLTSKELVLPKFQYEMNYSFVAFGAVEGEVIVDGVGMLLLMNYNKRLAKSRLNEVFFLHILQATDAQIKASLEPEAFAKEQILGQVRKVSLLISTSICMFEVLRENYLLSGLEEDISQSLSDALLNICKECFNADLFKVFGKEYQSMFEILGLQILFLTLAFRKVKKTSIPPVIMNSMRERINSIKVNKENPAEDVIFLSLLAMLLYTFRSLTSLVDVDNFLKVATKMLRSEEDIIYHKILVILLAVIMNHGLVTEPQKDEMKSTLNVTFMDVLSINASELPRELWPGLMHNPLENSNFIEHWKDAISRDHSQVVFPVFPKGSVLLKV